MHHNLHFLLLLAGSPDFVVYGFGVYTIFSVITLTVVSSKNLNEVFSCSEVQKSWSFPYQYHWEKS
jgi:hypothetical protein